MRLVLVYYFPITHAQSCTRRTVETRSAQVDVEVRLLRSSEKRNSPNAASRIDANSGHTVSGEHSRNNEHGSKNAASGNATEIRY